MIDVNAALGHWPFGPLRHNTPPTLLKWLATAGIRQACVAPLEATLYIDVQPANRLLHHTVKPYRRHLLPFCVINPAFPGWQEDVQECIDPWRTAGVRLLPGYHSYAISDTCCMDLLALCQQHDLPVQIAPVLADPRMHHPKAHVPAASLDGLPEIIQRFPRLRIALLNIRENDPALKDADFVRRCPNLFFDIAWVDGVDVAGTLVNRFGDDHILLGTSAPLMIPISATHKVREADLSPDQVERITRGNALRFLGRSAFEGAVP